ncbi:MAG: photosynthetic reaction center cytochrome PufC [Burkholderiales bacterium]|nr:photosynthetic reaction center cytochrome PufC [Burkholderiales bacterium]
MNANTSRLAAAAGVAAALLLAGCERPPMESTQQGFRGTGMVDIQNPRILAARAAANVAPAPTPPAEPGSPPATSVYKNVQVLTDLSVNDFNRLMVAITTWVAPPDKACLYCHVEGKDLSEDNLYTKVVARRMLQMTRHINADWKKHVADTGVTCYTCHRGQAVPANYWTADPGPRTTRGLAGSRAGQNAAAQSVALASLPYDPFSPFLGGAQQIRVLAPQALPNGHEASIQQTEATYGLMMHISQALGENCTFCHNSRSFASWEGPPTRATAWYGIRMVRDLNAHYLEPLGKTYPAERLGPLGDAPKANCATCHQGMHKPLGGANMLKDYPALAAVGKVAVAAPVPEPVVVGEMVVVYFGVGSAALHDAAPKTLTTIVAKLKADPRAKATVSGYHSATGDAAANQELAKNRAVAVRDALKVAGIAEERVVLVKPIAVQANVAGEDPQARRVEVTVK